MGKLGFLVPVLLASAIPSFAAGQAPEDLVAAVRERDRAIDALDLLAWERLTAPGFTIVDRNGRLLTRTEQLAQFVRDRASQPTGLPLIYVDGIPLRSSADRGEVLTCGNGTVVLGSTPAVAIRRCATAAGAKLEVWTKTTAGWQAFAVQYTPTA